MKKLLVVLALTVWSNAAFAIDFTQVLFNNENPKCPFKNSFTTVKTSFTVASASCSYSDEDKNKPDLTLGEAIYAALMINYPDEKDVTGEEKFKRGDLAQRIRTNNDYQLNPGEELALVKKLVGKLYGTSLVYAIYPLIDANYLKKK